MSKLNLVILLFSFVCSHFSEAQVRPTIKWGLEFKAPRRSSLNDIVGYDNTGIYAIKERYGFGTRKYTLEHYDEKLTPTRSVDLDFKDEGLEADVELILQLKNRLYLFTSVTNSRTKKNTLSVQQINKKTLMPEAKKIPVATIDFRGERSFNSGNFQVETSRDSSKVLIFYNLPFNKNEPEAFGFTVLDDNLQPLWNKEVNLPYEDELCDLESFRVDNDGDVYLLGLIYSEKRKSKRRGSPNYKYQVFAYRDQGNTMDEYPISLPDKFITDMQLEVQGAKKDLICAGFYSQTGTFSIRGTYFLRVDAGTKEIKAQSFKEFDIDFIIQNMKEGEANKTKRREARGAEHELYEYDLDRLLIGKDGSAILLGEQYYVKVSTYTTTTNGMTQTYSNYHYYYNDIIAVKIDPSGKIAWAEKIAKRQHSIDDSGFYSSYTSAIVKGNICFIFNDNPKNLTYDGVGKVFNYVAGGPSVVTMVTLDQSGKQVREPLFRSLDVEVIVRPKVCEQIKNNEIILFGQRKKTQQFARLTF